MDLSNYATKTDIKILLMLILYKLDIDKLVPVPVDLSNLKDVVKNNVVKNVYVYDKWMYMIN